MGIFDGGDAYRALGVRRLINAAGADTASADAAQELQHRVKTHIGITTKVEVTVPGTLARSEGKAKHVFDNRPK